MTLPSGPGQTTKNESLSIAFATDLDPIEVKSPDHSADETFALAKWAGSAGGAALGTDQDPNTSEPGEDRILHVTAKRDGVMTFGGAQLRLVTSGDGTSLVVQPWFKDDTQRKWIKHGAAQTITTATTNVANVVIGNMSGAKIFVQITANNGGVTALGYDVT